MSVPAPTAPHKRQEGLSSFAPLAYNGDMSTEADYYRALGIEPGATMEQVRAAYRRAACRCHPDLQQGNSLHAERKLRELIVAYKAIARRLNLAAWSHSRYAQRKTYTPQDFAREGCEKWRQVEQYVDVEEPEGFLLPLRRREAYPTRNETRTFAALWVLAVVLGIFFAVLAAAYRAHQVGFDNMSNADTIFSIIVGEVAYVLLAVSAVVFVILTRKLVRLTLRLASNRWLFLPRPVEGRTLPPQSKRIDDR